MRWKILIVSLLSATSAFAQSPAPQASGAGGKRPFTFEDMMKLKRVGSPVPSPDGKWILFDAVDVDLEANTKKSHLWIVPASGGDARRFNPTENQEERPRFSPDGKRLIWTSKATDPTQIWMGNFNSETGALEGEAHQVTNISSGADGGIWSPDGKNIVFTSSVYPDCKDDACNQQRDEELGKSKVKAKLFTKLLYRHWTAFTENKRSHLFVVNADASAGPAAGSVGESVGRDSVEPGGPPTQLPSSTQSRPTGAEPRDLTPGDRDVPPFNLGGQDLYAISPDGQEVAYTSNPDEVEATSTNNEIFLIPITGGTPKKISSSPGNDNTPVYSPDGELLAWKSMARGGFEADKESLIIYQRKLGQGRNATANWDRSVGSLTWAADSKTLFFTAEDHGEAPIYSLAFDAKQPTEIARLHADDLVFGAENQLFFSRVSIAAPSEIWRLDVSRKDNPTAVTHVNDALLAQIDMRPMESFTFKGAGGAEVQGFMIKPPGFEPNKKYPLKFLIHGGPQGAWGNSWTYRWNAELFAASSSVGRDSVEPGGPATHSGAATSPSGSTESRPTGGGSADGYVVVMINPRGSTGYGQAFTDGVSGDWGGKPYEDLMKGLDYVEKTYPFIDKNREAAMGASYGGYMANWLLGHTDRFKCVVSHDGVFNTESAYGETEELWFTEWEFKGPPWKNRELYRKFSPHLFADKFKTPTLVVHGQLDYRLDVAEGFQLFTTLQRLGVPSKMLYFPDEGHWVLKPQNSQLWYKTVDSWVDQWCGAK